MRQLDGEDPVAFVISANHYRRHMTKGQRAMAWATLYPQGKQGERTDLKPKEGATSIPSIEVADAPATSAARALS